MNIPQKKILLAIDGSQQSLEAVRYVGRLLAPKNIEVVLFHVMWKVNEALYDIGIESLYHQRIMDIRTWELEQKKQTQAFMNKARRILIDSGLPEKLVTVNIHQRKAGIARDIIIESKEGYCAVVVGQKGLSKLKDLVIGSVAEKLINKIAHIPLWVVGGKPETEKILLALDASEGSMRAVDYVGAMMGGSNCSVTLLHVTRDVHFLQQIDTIPSEHDALTKEIAKDIMPVFDEAENRLINAGLIPGQVTTSLITGISSRAGAIIEEARQGGYGTIAIGRRGMSKVEEFFMGRVSNKVIHLAKETAVWVVT